MCYYLNVHCQGQRVKGLRNSVRNVKQEGNFTELVTSKEVTSSKKVLSLVVGFETGHGKLNFLKMGLST